MNMNSIMNIVTGVAAGLAASACEKIDAKLSESCTVTKRQLAYGAAACALAGLVCGVMMTNKKRPVIIQSTIPEATEKDSEEAE